MYEHCVYLYLTAILFDHSNATERLYQLSLTENVFVFMKKIICILPLTIGLCSLLFQSCKKDNTKPTDCFSKADSYRQIVDKPATVRQQPGGTFFIVEQGTVNTRLNPCNLPTDFQVDNLQVTISGDVKATMQGGPGPCCTEILVITKITR